MRLAIYFALTQWAMKFLSLNNPNQVEQKLVTIYKTAEKS